MPFLSFAGSLLDRMGGALRNGGQPAAPWFDRRAAATSASPQLKRNLPALAANFYDVAVVGGGIYGISLARDAAMRGLRVALVEKGDFGHATSSNHHRIVHGGLRYLQHADIRRIRESVCERSILLRIASPLVRPLPFLIPTRKRLFQSKLLMTAALKMNDWLSADRNRNLPPQQQIPSGRVISKSECVALCEAFDQPDITGGALFFDAQVSSPQRLNLAVLKSAVEAGAEVANYVQATNLLRRADSISGVEVKDLLSADTFSIQARVVVNCAGPWTAQLLEQLGILSKWKNHSCKSLVFVTRPLVKGEIAIGIPSRSGYMDHDALIQKGFRYLFVTPWRNRSLVGTFQTTYSGHPDDLRVEEAEITHAINQVNAALPNAQLSRRDIVSVFRGLVPAGEEAAQGEAQLRKHHEICDHARTGGIDGLISVSGIKYTTARKVAEDAVNLILNKLHKNAPQCRTATEPLCGASEDRETILASALKNRTSVVGNDLLQHLVESHGGAYSDVLNYGVTDPRLLEPIVAGSPVLKAEVLHGVRAEMAQTLEDVVYRRTELAASGQLEEPALHACAGIMAAELGWSPQQIRQQVERVRRQSSGDMDANI